MWKKTNLEEILQVLYNHLDELRRSLILTKTAPLSPGSLWISVTRKRKFHGPLRVSIMETLPFDIRTKFKGIKGMVFTIKLLKTEQNSVPYLKIYNIPSC